ncbi:MAG TPA: DUF1592 domain-containing protein [Verrucomicrobiales bacterium]|nr:DUF1592 domain-containing protein [Verrucomicrobiales bacterium]
MRLLLPRHCLIVSLIVTCATSLGAETISYKMQVAPLLEKYCVTCHGPDKRKNDVRVDVLDLDFVKGNDRETWHDILDMLNLGDMPPEEESQPSSRERQLVVDWITGKMTEAALERRSTNGLGVLRRLTRYEYSNTMSDLLGVRLDYAKNLPSESNSHDGFQNNGSIMGMSSMQLEYYLQAAQLGLKVALVEGPQPERYEEFSTENAPRRANRSEKTPNTRKIQPGNSFWVRLMEYPSEGPVCVRVKAHAVIPEGKGPPRMRVRIGLRADTYVTGGRIGEDVDVVASAEEPGVYEFVGRLEHYPMLGTLSNFPGLLVNVHNIYDDGSEAIEVYDLKINQQYKVLNKPDPAQPWLVVESVEVVINDYADWPPAYHQSILIRGVEVPEDETGYAREVLEHFMTRAYRRPPTAEEVDGILGFYKEVRPDYPTFIQAIRQALSMVLISPQFLYLIEPVEFRKGTRKLSAYEVASRLSYFLWSTMPDEELMKLAANRTLLKSSVLKKQVRRMLEDSRIKRFVEQFTDQWLDLQALDRVAVNPQFYPNFKARAKKAMRLESQQFFAEILNHDLSALNFIESDFTMLNERLAKHYGIAGVTGNKMTRVALLPEHRRGGLLTQGSMLVGNSTGEDSHPIDRAVWVLERLLNDPPSPPPANVPTLDAETPGFAKLTLKDQLAVHRQDEACMNCHRKIDPWGIPLEHYDATGLYRTEAIRLTAKKKGQSRNKKDFAEIDAFDTMPDGHTINGVNELKAYLLKEKKDKFARAMVAKMTTYALGRSLEFTDEEAITRLAEKFKKRDYRLDNLIHSIVGSKLFLKR